VRIRLLTDSINGVMPAPKQYTVEGKSYPNPDSRMRASWHVFVMLQNHMLIEEKLQGTVDEFLEAHAH